MKALFANSLDVMLDAEWEESKVKRDEGGRFALKPGQSTEEAHRGPNGEWNKQTQKLHGKVLGTLLGGKESKNKPPNVYLLGGGSASGKSTGFNAMYAEKFRNELMHIDSDKIKEMIPEYAQLKKTDPENAARLVHEESSYLAKMALATGAAKKIDMVYDSTGAGSGIQDMAKSMKQKGYKVHVVFFDIPIAEAQRRSAKRASGPAKRFVPDEVLQKSHKGSAKNFAAMTEGRYIDSMKLFDNSERIPALVYSKKGHKKGIVVDGDKWKEYLKKSAA